MFLLVISEQVQEKSVICLDSTRDSAMSGLVFLTGKGLTYGGSLARTEATGFGLCYFTNEMLKANGKSFKDQTVVISGSGNVAIYATKKATEFGAKVVALSDSNGYVYDPDGIELDNRSAD